MKNVWVAVLASCFMVVVMANAAEPRNRGASESASKAAGKPATSDADSAGAGDKIDKPVATSKHSTPPPAPKTPAEAQSQYDAAVINCNKEAGFAKTDCMKKAAKARDQAMVTLKSGAGAKAGVESGGAAGRAGASGPGRDDGANSASGNKR